MRGKGCVSDYTDKEFFHHKSRMRSLLLLASIIIFSSAEDRIVNVDVPDIGQPGNKLNILITEIFIRK